VSKGWTVQSLIDGKMMLHAYCHAPRCRHSQKLDLAKLRDKLGPDAPAMAADLIPRLRCAKCGGKEVGLIYAPDPHQNTGMGVSSYRRAKGG
jgi:hypothetical protein